MQTVRNHAFRLKPRNYGLFLTALFILCVLNTCTGDLRRGPYLIDATPQGVTICWVSQRSNRGQVEVNSATGGAPFIFSDIKPETLHRTVIKGLMPGTRYNYSISGEGPTEKGSFKTAPAASQPFHFAVFGDTRSQKDRHAAIIRQLVLLDPDFVLQTGDLVENGSKEPLWSDFFSIERELLRRSPYYPVPGNHEGEASNYFKYFPHSRNYSFDYGNAHFIGLDTNITSSQFAAQEKWLRADLAAHKNAVWRIVFCHHPLYSSSTGSSRIAEAARLSARLLPILKTGQVQLVLSGHDHNYQRYESEGIQFIVTGGGGAPLYAMKVTSPLARKTARVYHVCSIHVNGSALSIHVIQPDGTLVEDLQLKANQ